MKKTGFLALILACLMILSALPVRIAAETAEVMEVAAYADTYVSSVNPDMAYGNADELKLSAAGKDENIIFISFSSSILQNEHVDVVIPDVDIPGDATNTVDVEVYVLSDAIDEATLTYNTMPSLSSAYFMGMFKFKNGDNLLDLSSIKSVVSGEYFTLAIRMVAHYYYEDFNDLSSFFLSVDPANDKNDYNQCFYSTNMAFPGGEPESKGLGSVDGDTVNSTKAMYYYTQKTTARAKLANTLSYDELSLNDLGRRYRVTFDVYSMLGAKVTYGIMSANGGAAVSEYSGPKSSCYTTFYTSAFIGDSDNVTPTAKTWTPVTFDVTVDQTMITSQIGCVTVQCSGATASEDSKFYFDNFKVVEVTADGKTAISDIVSSTPSKESEGTTVKAVVCNSRTKGEAIADTYVSVTAPNTVFGNDKTVKIGNGDIAFMTFHASDFEGAEAVSLTIPSVVSSAKQSVSVYLIDGYVVDENSLCYNTAPKLIDNWLIGTYDLAAGDAVISTDELMSRVNYPYFTVAISGTAAVDWKYSLDFTGLTSIASTDDVTKTGTWLIGRGGAIATPVIEQDPTDETNNVMGFGGTATGTASNRFRLVGSLPTLTTDYVNMSVNISYDVYLNTTHKNHTAGSSVVFKTRLAPATGYSGFLGEEKATATAGWNHVTQAITITSKMVSTQTNYITIDIGAKGTVCCFDNFKVTLSAVEATFAAKEDYEAKHAYLIPTPGVDVDMDFTSTTLAEGFTATDATVSDGVITVNNGGSLVFTDSRLDLLRYNNYRGFTVEFKVNSAAPASGTKPLVKMSGTDVLVIDSEGKIVIDSDVGGKYPVTPNIGQFTSVQLAFVAGSGKVSIFADGKLLGDVASGLKTNAANVITFCGDAIYDDIKIHSTLVREFARESKMLFDWDMEYYTFTSGESNCSPGAKEGKTPSDGVSVIGKFQEYKTDGDGVSYLHKNAAGGGQTEIFLTGFVNDAVTVFETKIRNNTVLVDGVTAASGTTDIFRTRKATHATSNHQYLLTMDNANGYLHFVIDGTSYFLCDKEGKLLVVKDVNGEVSGWTEIAIVYDAVSATMRYVVDNSLTYYTATNNAEGNEVLGVADGLRINALDFNRLESEELRLRFYAGAGTGAMDMAYYRAYQIGSSATAEIVADQPSQDGSAFRIIAGVDMLHYEKVGFEVEIYDSDKNETRILYPESSSVYSSVEGDGKIYTAEDLGYRYLATVSVSDIVKEGTTANGTLKVTPYTRVGETKYYGVPEEYTVENGVVTHSGYKTTPISNAVFNTTEVVQYRGEGLNFNGTDAIFAFGADCEGDVVINMATAPQVSGVAESEFELYVDGNKKENIKLGIGHWNVVLAENLEKGTHTFKLVKKTGGDYVQINNITLNGTFTDAPLVAKEKGVVVVFEDYNSDKGYVSFDLYTQTSTDNFFIKYNFDYEKDAPHYDGYMDYKADTQYNRSNYRIRTAYLVENTSTAKDVYTFNSKYQVLHQGEISLAIKENGTTDFVGGYHGDENLIAVELIIDGKVYDLSSAENAGKTVVGTTVNFNQVSVVDRCDSENEGLFLHTQNYVIDSNGIRNRQQVELLVDDFSPNVDQTFLQMFTFYRVRGSYTLCNKISVTDAAGNCLTYKDSSGNVIVDENGEAATSFNPNEYVKSTLTVTNGKTARYINYNGDIGISAKTGFNIVDGSVTLNSAKVNVRQYDDAKWYPSFVGSALSSSTAPKAGDVWDVDLYYTIDYVAPTAQ